MFCHISSFSEESIFLKDKNGEDNTLSVKRLHSKVFEIELGLRGDVISATLFDPVLEYAMRNALGNRGGTVYYEVTLILPLSDYVYVVATRETDWNMLTLCYETLLKKWTWGSIRRKPSTCFPRGEIMRFGEVFERIRNFNYRVSDKSR